MRHENYHELSVFDNRELGFSLGRIFGENAQKQISERVHKPDWEGKFRQITVFIEATRKFFPKFNEELSSYAEGAGVKLEEFWVLFMEDDLDQSPEEKCTTVIAGDGSAIGHNEDWDVGSENELSVLRKKINGLTIFELYYRHTLGGNSVSINSHGVVQCIDALNHRRSGGGIPSNVIARWLSESSDPHGDFDLLSRLPRQRGYNHAFVMSGGVINIECTADRQIMTKPALPFVHTNHLLAPEIKSFDLTDNSSWTFERYARAMQLAQEEIYNTAALRDVMSDTSSGLQSSIFNERTIGRMIIDLEKRIASVWLRREKEKGWIDYPLDFLP